ncbi:MAG: hypothetical protein AAGF24_04635 [Cyanobacteria bacterium P01_H01_bin.121]
MIDLGVPYDGQAAVSPRGVTKNKRVKILKAMLDGDPTLFNESTLMGVVAINNIPLINLVLSQMPQKIKSSVPLEIAIRGGDPNVIQLIKAHTPPDLLNE